MLLASKHWEYFKWFGDGVASQPRQRQNSHTPSTVSFTHRNPLQNLSDSYGNPMKIPLFNIFNPPRLVGIGSPRCCLNQHRHLLQQFLQLLCFLSGIYKEIRTARWPKKRPMFGGFSKGPNIWPADFQGIGGIWWIHHSRWPTWNKIILG